MKKLIIPLIVLILAASCREPTALLDAIQDDVKSANDLYLEILSISPDENQLFTNPGAEIRIEFDRAIDMTNIDELISLTNTDGESFGESVDSQSLKYSFDESSNILTISAEPYLDGLEQYKVHILDSLTGKDGSKLRDVWSWNFSTEDVPLGYLEVPTYSNSVDVSPETTVNVYSQGASFYILGTSKAAVDASTDWQTITSNPMELTNETIQDNDSTTFYVKFRDGMIGNAGTANVSSIEEATIIHDDIPPVITMDTDPLYGNIANGGDPTASASVVDTGSGIYRVVWSDPDNPFGGPLTFASSTKLTTLIDTGKDVLPKINDSFTIRFTAYDKAGNSSYVERPLIRDVYPPGDPSSITRTTTTTTPRSTAVYITNDLTPNYSISGFDSVDDTLTCRVYDSKKWSAWEAYASRDSMSYGNGQQISFRVTDVAGNINDFLTDSYLIYPTAGTSPADTATIKGDLVFPWNSSAEYYKVFLGNAKGQSEIVLYYRGLPIKRENPCVDTSELSLILNSTYYWYYESWNDPVIGKDSLIYRSSVLSFNTNLKGL